MMWMLQYVKGEDNLADMVVDGRIISKWSWRTWNGGVAWANSARSRLQWCMRMKMLMNLRVPYKDGYSWPAERLSSSLKGLFSAQWRSLRRRSRCQWNTYSLVQFAQGYLTPLTTNARKWNLGTSCLATPRSKLGDAYSHMMALTMTSFSYFMFMVPCIIIYTMK